MATEIEVQCPWCGQELVAEATMGGEAVDCPACGKSVRIASPGMPDGNTVDPDGQAGNWQECCLTDTPEECTRDTSANLLCGILGSLVLMIGVFMPIARAPVVGQLNYFLNGEGDGVFILVLALISLALTLRRAFGGLYFTALCSLALMVYTFVGLKSRIDEVRAGMATDLKGNPFRDLADVMVGSVEMQWGWGVLLAGVIFLLIAASFTSERP